MTERPDSTESTERATETDVDEVEAGEKEPGSRSDEVERAAEREEDAAEG